MFTVYLMFQAAARKAIASVVFSRIVMASPGMCEFKLVINYSYLPSLQFVANIVTNRIKLFGRIYKLYTMYCLFFLPD